MSMGNVRKEPQIAVVTGASAGVGRAIVRELARKGARIGLIARGTDGLEGAKRDVQRLGGEAIMLPTDVADPDQVERAAEQVDQAFGPVDLWINNAMASVFSPVVETTPQEYRRVTEVTYLGYVHGTLCALKRMRARNRGVIVQVGSALAYRGIPLQSAYCAAKHAIQGFQDSLRSELLHEGSAVRVMMVQLPAVNTPQFRWVKSRLPRKAKPVPPIFQPEEIARAIVWAAQHDRPEVYVGWPTTKAIVGNKIAPQLGDWYLARTGYDSQQVQEPEDPNRPHNLWEPVPGDHGAHGVFDHMAKDHSIQWWMNRNRGALALAALGLASGAMGLYMSAARKRSWW